MPFRRSCRITATNEGTRTVDAFYYYVDYRELPEAPPDAAYFHAQYRQEFPPGARRDYTLLKAEGAGHYVGSVLSVLQRAMGWWGEGDDRFRIDGETKPSLHGTGSEDYFSDAWGMREGHALFYGCPLQEEDFQAGSKASVYRFHIPDPVPFKTSIEVTIEHGHANDRSDDVSSVAFWYQVEPHRPFAALPPAAERLPFAFEPPEGFVLPAWEPEAAGQPGAFVDRSRGLRVAATRLVSAPTSFYNASGARYPALRTDGAGIGTRVEFRFPVEIRDRYEVELYFLRSAAAGNLRVLAGPGPESPAGGNVVGRLDGYAKEPALAPVTLKDLVLAAGPNTLVFEIEGREAASAGADLAFVGFALKPKEPRFVRDWNLVGPFNAADMDDLTTVYPPETEAAPAASYKGKNGATVRWRTFKAEGSGYVRLDDLIKPNEQAIVYGSAYVHAPDEREAWLLLGSDDGVRVWINGGLVHTNPVYRAAEPDLDRVRVRLNKGWNKVLVKDLQGAGGWGFYLRFADPDGALRYALKPE
jgi:hypothetical protein